MSHSGRFSHSTATRSPRSRPKWIISLARALTRAEYSAQLILSHRPKRLTRNAVPVSAALRRSSAGTLRARVS